MLNRLLTQREQFLLLFVGLAIVAGGLSVVLSQRKTESLAGSATISANEQPANTIAAKPDTNSPSNIEVPAKTATTADEPLAPAPDTAVEPPKPAEIAVAAMGAVETEGLYRLPADARVGDLIKKAGGATQDADLSDLNLGARLIDGTTLTVPSGASARFEDGKMTLRGSAAQYAPNPPQYSRAYAASHAGQAASAPQSAAEEEAVDTPGDSAAKAADDGKVNLNTATQQQLEELPGIGPALAQRIIEYRNSTPFATVDQLDEVPGFGEKRVAQLRSLVTVN